MEPWGCFLGAAVLRESPAPRGGDAPVLLLTAENDDLAWPAAVREDVAPLCAAGYRVEYRECAKAGHVDGAIASLPYQLAWAKAAAAGEALPGVDCTVPAPVTCGE